MSTEQPKDAAAQFRTWNCGGTRVMKCKRCSWRIFAGSVKDPILPKEKYKDILEHLLGHQPKE
jgi:hypothetical protein